MKKLTDLVEVLSALKKISKRTLKHMLPVMKELMVDNNYIVDEVVVRSDAPVDVATEYLQSVTLGIIADAETVKREVDAFAEIIEISQKDIKKNIQKYPFIAEVWFGDTFDGLSGVSALKKLLEDLKVELGKANDDWIIESAVEFLAKTHLKNNK